MDTESDVLASDFDLIQLEDINVAARRMCEFVVSRRTLKSSVWSLVILICNYLQSWWWQMF